MADKLSNLLSAERLRPIWRRQVVQPLLTGNEPPSTTLREDVQGEIKKQIELGAAQIARGVPIEVMRQLELALRQQLGSRYALLGHLLHPLRHAIEQVQQGGVAASVHPLTRAASDGVPQLIDRIDDAVTAMLRVQRRAERLLERLW